MKFERENCTFTIPDRPTVRQQLEWFSAASSQDQNDKLARWWEGAKALIETWECKVLPDLHSDIDTLSDPSQTTVIIWVGTQVLNFMNSLEDVPKN